MTAATTIASQQAITVRECAPRRETGTRMLQNYKRKGWLGAAAFLATDVAGLVLLGVGGSNGFAFVFLAIGLVALFYAVISFAKGKGYSAWYGAALLVAPVLLANMMLPRRHAAGVAGLATIVGLLLLPDKHPLVDLTQPTGPSWRDNLGVAWRMVVNWIRPKA